MYHVSRHWIRPWWRPRNACSFSCGERKRERKKISFEASVTTTLYNLTPESSRVGFAFSEHWAGCAVPNTKEREKGASINCRSAGSRRSLFLLRTTNLSRCFPTFSSSFSSTSSQLSTRNRPLVVFPPLSFPPFCIHFASLAVAQDLGDLSGSSLGTTEERKSGLNSSLNVC